MLVKTIKKLKTKHIFYEWVVCFLSKYSVKSLLNDFPKNFGYFRQKKIRRFYRIFGRMNQLKFKQPGWITSFFSMYTDTSNEINIALHNIAFNHLWLPRMRQLSETLRSQYPINTTSFYPSIIPFLQPPFACTITGQWIFHILYRTTNITKTNT